MTAYRSSNDYRQDLLRYDGGVNVTVAGSAVAGTSTVPGVTVTQGAGVTVTPAVIATAATTPAVTVTADANVAASTITGTAAVPSVTVTQGAGVTVSLSTVAVAGTIPDPTVTQGTGVTVTPSAVAAAATAPEATVGEGAGITVTPSQIDGVATVPSIDLAMRYVPTTENIVPQLDVVPYFTNDPARRLARFRTPGARGRNVFILTSGAVTTRQPVNPALVSRELLGGHESPTDLTSEELDALVGAGYSVEVR